MQFCKLAIQPLIHWGLGLVLSIEVQQNISFQGPLRKILHHLMVRKDTADSLESPIPFFTFNYSLNIKVAD